MEAVYIGMAEITTFFNRQKKILDSCWMIFESSTTAMTNGNIYFKHIEHKLFQLLKHTINSIRLFLAY
jgi:hypothetical protein